MRKLFLTSAVAALGLSGAAMAQTTATAATDLNVRSGPGVQHEVIGAITLSAVHLQEVNTSYWPDFPWVEVAETYDLGEATRPFAVVPEVVHATGSVARAVGLCELSTRLPSPSSPAWSVARRP